MGRWTGRLCVYSHDVCVGCIYYCMHVWGRDNFQESAVSFPFDLGPRDRTQVTQLAHQVLLGRLATPSELFPVHHGTKGNA